MMDNNRIKIVYIASHSRSGSTVIDRVLGQVAGAFTVGEMRHIWERSFIENHLCGCGETFSNCVIWKDIIDNAGPGLDIEYAKKTYDISRTVDRFKKIPFIIHPGLRSKTFTENLELYKESMRRLYNSIQQTINPLFIIDSSKNPSYAYILREIPTLDVHVIHLVRDSRAVAYSRLRKKIRPEIHWKKEYMAITPPYKTAIEWNLVNYALDSMKKSGSYSLLRYEDFVKNPRKELEKIITDIGVAERDLSFIDGSKVDLTVDHTLSGNPMRFKVGEVELLCDEEWKKSLNKKYKRFMNVATRPFLKKYGYI